MYRTRARYLPVVIVLHCLASAVTADNNTNIGNVQLETSSELVGRVAKEALIAAAITIAIIIPYLFDQIGMANDITRYNGRKTDVVGSNEQPPPSNVNGVSAPPQLPIGINSNRFFPGYPIDGPREYLIHTKSQKRLAKQSEKQKRHHAEDEVEEELVNLGPKPFTHVLIGAKGRDAIDEGLDAMDKDRSATVLTTAPLVAYPPLIRNRHRRVQPLYASSVLCCLDGAMDAEMAPIPPERPPTIDFETTRATTVNATNILTEPLMPAVEGNPGDIQYGGKKKIVKKKIVVRKGASASEIPDHDVDL